MPECENPTFNVGIVFYVNFIYLRLCLRLLSGAFLFLFLTYIKAKIAAAKLITSMDIKVDPMLIGFDFFICILRCYGLHKLKTCTRLSKAIDILSI